MPEIGRLGLKSGNSSANADATPPVPFILNSPMLPQVRKCLSCTRRKRAHRRSARQ